MLIVKIHLHACVNNKFKFVKMERKEFKWQKLTIHSGPVLWFIERGAK